MTNLGGGGVTLYYQLLMVLIANSSGNNYSNFVVFTLSNVIFAHDCMQKFIIWVNIQDELRANVKTYTNIGFVIEATTKFNDVFEAKSVTPCFKTVSTFRFAFSTRSRASFRFDNLILLF